MHASDSTCLASERSGHLGRGCGRGRALAQGFPSTSTGTTRTFALNPPSTSKVPGRLGDQRRLELKERVDEDEPEGEDEEEEMDENLLKALRRMGIRAHKQFDPKGTKILKVHSNVFSSI